MMPESGVTSQSLPDFNHGPQGSIPLKGEEMQVSPEVLWETFRGSLSTCKDFWSQFAHSCPHWSCNIPGIKSALRFKNKMGGTNWIRSPWQTSPPAECSPNWRNCNKKRCIFFFFPLLFSSLPCPSSQLFLCPKSPAYCSLSHQPSGIYLPVPIPTPLPPNTHILTDRPWSPGNKAVLSCLREGHRTGDGSAVRSCKDCQENKRGKKSWMYPFLPPLFLIYK